MLVDEDEQLVLLAREHRETLPLTRARNKSSTLEAF
jgi:hypothetical protein